MTVSLEKRRAWEEKIHQQRASGLSIERWCQENQIPAWKFHYWKSNLSPKTVERTSFTELTDLKESGITVEWGHLRIHLERDFDAETLKQCLAILKDIKC